MSTPYDNNQQPSQAGPQSPPRSFAGRLPQQPTHVPPTAQPPVTQPAPVPQQPHAQPAGENPWAASADGARAQSSPWAAQRRPQQERVTSRLRKVVEGLPDWEPLPPGETVVRRPGSTA